MEYVIRWLSCDNSVLLGFGRPHYQTLMITIHKMHYSVVGKEAYHILYSESAYCADLYFCNTASTWPLSCLCPSSIPGSLLLTANATRRVQVYGRSAATAYTLEWRPQLRKVRVVHQLTFLWNSLLSTINAGISGEILPLITTCLPGLWGADFT